MIIETFGNFYTCDPVSLQNAEKNCVEEVKKRIRKESHYAVNLIINLTWFWYRDNQFTKQCIDWIHEHAVPSSTKIYFTSFIDNVSDIRDSNCVKQIIEMGHEASFEGFGENWYSLFPNYIDRYEVSKLQLNPNFKYTYLSYNRKPKLHRENLITSLRNNNLVKHGWVTFQTGYFKEIDEAVGNIDSNLFKARDLIEYKQHPDPNLSRPDDVKSLGNIDIWNDSYLVIVTETSVEDPWHMTEKTWKPIMGLRPFVLVGHPNLLNILRKLEIRTPGELFNEPRLDNCDMPFIIEFIKDLCNKPNSHIYEMWNKQLPMLKYNRKRFEFLARSQVTPKIDINYSVPVTA